MSNQPVLNYHLVKVTGETFEEAADNLEVAVNEFMDTCRCSSQHYEPLDRPGSWHFTGVDIFHMVQAMVLRGVR